MSVAKNSISPKISWCPFLSTIIQAYILARTNYSRRWQAAGWRSVCVHSYVRRCLLRNCSDTQEAMFFDAFNRDFEAGLYLYYLIIQSWTNLNGPGRRARHKQAVLSTSLVQYLEGGIPFYHFNSGLVSQVLQLEFGSLEKLRSQSLQFSINICNHLSYSHCVRTRFTHSMSIVYFDHVYACPFKCNMAV